MLLVARQLCMLFDGSLLLTNAGLLPAGKPVNTLFVASKLQLTNEMYFAILLDRATAGPVMIGCSEGGTSIEELAEKHPDKIIKVGHETKECMLGTGTWHLSREAAIQD